MFIWPSSAGHNMTPDGPRVGYPCFTSSVCPAPSTLQVPREITCKIWTYSLHFQDVGTAGKKYLCHVCWRQDIVVGLMGVTNFSECYVYGLIRQYNVYRGWQGSKLRVRAFKFPNRAICFKEQAKVIDTFTYMFIGSSNLRDSFCYLTFPNLFWSSSQIWCPLLVQFTLMTWCPLMLLQKEIFTESQIPQTNLKGGNITQRRFSFNPFRVLWIFVDDIPIKQQKIYYFVR
jgi:hypothetical protein